jgi:RHS repeat-associated protein
VDYSSFGQILHVSNPDGVDRFLFTGRELDAELGIYFYRARYFCPNIGGFISGDPIGSLGSDYNLCRYSRNNPNAVIDPYGTDGIIGYLNTLSIRAYTALETRFLGLAIKYRFICTTILFIVGADRIEADKAIREVAGLLDIHISGSDTLSAILAELAKICGRLPDPFDDPLNYGDQGGYPGYPPYGAR